MSFRSAVISMNLPQISSSEQVLLERLSSSGKGKRGFV